MAKADYQEIIAEYKEQVRVLKEQVNELTDACKAKDSALKRALQKLEYTTDDLGKCRKKMKLSENFSLIERTKSQTAERQGIDNTPGPDHQNFL